MTIQGTLTKTALLLAVALATASFTWPKAELVRQNLLSSTELTMWSVGGMLGGFVLSMIIMWKPTWASRLALPYAAVIGLFLGAVSGMYKAQFSGKEALAGLGGGIVFQAVILTFAVTLAMLGLYSLRIIKVTDRLRSIVFSATAGIMLFYGVAFVLRFFGVEVPLIHSSSMLGVGFSVFVVGLAAFNLLLDFDMIEKGSAGGAPKHMEWYGAVGLVVTLVWLYIEILRLLAKLRSND
jgi:uncharacterized YccA/Bax inhibitor family protein